jgi:hypothetical protein
MMDADDADDADTKEGKGNWEASARQKDDTTVHTVVSDPNKAVNGGCR